MSLFRKNDGPNSASFSVFLTCCFLTSGGKAVNAVNTILKTSVIRIKEVEPSCPVLSRLPAWDGGKTGTKTVV